MANHSFFRTKRSFIIAAGIGGGFLACGVVSMESSMESSPSPEPRFEQWSGATVVSEKKGCEGAPPCESDCDNSVDDDGDGRFDCEDEDCREEHLCLEKCKNGVDDDHDGYVDCDDRDCIGQCPSEENCNAPGDEDNDGYADCEQYFCRVSRQECENAAVAACDAAEPLLDGVTVTGTTVGGSNIFRAENCWNASGGLPERVFTFSPQRPGEFGVLKVDFDPVGNNLLVAAFSDCSGWRGAEKRCGRLGFDMVLRGESKIYVVVDGYSGSGEFALTARFVVPPCGNGVVEAPEQCDPPDGTTCDVTCQRLPPVYAPETDCTDLIDDEKDGLTDCADPDCQGRVECKSGKVKLGQPCTTHSDCAATGNDPLCLPGYGGRYCTESCNLGTPECGERNLCRRPGMPQFRDTRVCMKSCQDRKDCLPGYQCGISEGMYDTHYCWIFE